MISSLDQSLVMQVIFDDSANLLQESTIRKASPSRLDTVCRGTFTGLIEL